MSNAAFVLMNCDLVAVPMQLGAGVVTIYCGMRRANELKDAGTRSGPGHHVPNPWPDGAAPALPHARCIARREAARDDRQ